MKIKTNSIPDSSFSYDQAAKDLCEQLAGKVVHNLLKNTEELTFSVSEDAKKIIDVTVLFKANNGSVEAAAITSSDQSFNFIFAPTALKEAKLNMLLEDWIRSLSSTSINALTASGRNIHFSLTENGRSRQVEIRLFNYDNGKIMVKIYIDIVHRFSIFDGLSANGSSFIITSRGDIDEN